jgi:hypothetical protein
VALLAIFTVALACRSSVATIGTSADDAAQGREQRALRDRLPSP